jgi:hypothetical protein
MFSLKTIVKAFSILKVVDFLFCTHLLYTDYQKLAKQLLIKLFREKSQAQDKI